MIKYVTNMYDDFDWNIYAFDDYISKMQGIK